jgi:hypothetical protein
VKHEREQVERKRQQAEIEERKRTEEAALAAAGGVKENKQVTEAKNANVCVLKITGQNFIDQIWYRCLTCGIKRGGDGVCITCKYVFITPSTYHLVTCALSNCLFTPYHNTGIHVMQVTTWKNKSCPHFIVNVVCNHVVVC